MLIYDNEKLKCRKMKRKEEDDNEQRTIKGVELFHDNSIVFFYMIEIFYQEPFLSNSLSSSLLFYFLG